MVTKFCWVLSRQCTVGLSLKRVLGCCSVFQIFCFRPKPVCLYCELWRQSRAVWIAWDWVEDSYTTECLSSLKISPWRASSQKHLAFVCCVKNITVCRACQVHLTKPCFYSFQRTQKRLTQNISVRFCITAESGLSETKMKQNPGRTPAVIDSSSIQKEKQTNVERRGFVTVSEGNKEFVI